MVQGRSLTHRSGQVILYLYFEITEHILVPGCFLHNKIKDGSLVAGGCFVLTMSMNWSVARKDNAHVKEEVGQDENRKGRGREKVTIG